MAIVLRNGTVARRAHGGFSLVEVLIAMTLGIILLGGMIAAFIGNRQSSELNSAIANMQESARYAIDSIAEDVRAAGFQGCFNVQRQSATVLSSNQPPLTNMRNSAANGSVIDAAGNWNPAPPNGFDPDNHVSVPGTQTLALAFGDPNNTRLLSTQMLNGGGTAPSLAAPVSLRSPLPNAETGDFAMISNCERGAMFTITGISADGLQLQHAAPSNSNNANLNYAYGAPEEQSQTIVTLLHNNVYYVGDTGLTNAQGDSIYSLYRQSLPFGDPTNNPPVELVTGIENMRVAFGIRQAGGSLRYVPADSADYNPGNIEALQIGLLMTSRDRIADQDDEKTYRLAGQAIPPALGNGAPGASHPVDRRYRLAFNTTIKIRNRRDQ